jgi:hypothetical protein
MDATYIDLTVRLSLALILGGAIGIEREYRAKEAGFRTHFLVALGSALFCVVSQYGFGFDLKDSSRVAAQVVSGIGFLGAGTIIVVIAAATYIPVPQANPMAAVTHKPAAVVKPLTTFFWKMMVPAPRNPIPETTWAATREESFRSKPNPYWETTQKSALPRATRK